MITFKIYIFDILILDYFSAIIDLSKNKLKWQEEKIMKMIRRIRDNKFTQLNYKPLSDGI